MDTTRPMRMDYEDYFVTVDGLKVRYWDQGSGPPLLLIHGIGVSAEIWAWNVETLSQHHRVIALDLPGFGRSARTARAEVFTRDYAADFLDRFVRALGIESLAVAGNSLGGYLALCFALAHPETVRQLILVDAAGLGKEITIGIRLMSIPGLGELIARPSRLLTRVILYGTVHNRGRITGATLDRHYELYKTPGTSQAMLRTIRNGVNLAGQTAAFPRPELARLGMPVLVVWGAQDIALPAKHAAAAAGAIPDCRAAALEGAGHGPMIDRPEVFHELVIEFLASGKLGREEGGGRHFTYSTSHQPAKAASGPPDRSAHSRRDRSAASRRD